MFSLPNPLPSDKQALQALAQMATEDLLPASNGDFIAANRCARAMYPTLFQAIQDAVFTAPATVTPILSNADRAAICNPSEDNIATFGLCRTTTPEEYAAAFKAAGNQVDRRKAPEVFSALQDMAMDKQSLNAAAAASAVAIRHPNLFKFSSMVETARELGSDLPETIFGSDTRVNKDAVGAGPKNMETTPPKLPFERGGKPGLESIKGSALTNEDRLKKALKDAGLREGVHFSATTLSY